MNDLKSLLEKVSEQKPGALDRHNVSLDEFTFEILFKSSLRKRLFVFTSSGARKNGNTETLFNRQKWAPDIDGVCLYLEDPCIKYYGGIPTGWFYGTKTVSFMRLAYEIIDGIRRMLDIDVGEVFFVGSSSGGYNALYLSDYMRGSNAICDNPQFYLRHSGSHPRLEKAVGVRITDPDPFQRADVARILKNTESRFYIEVNRNSRHDFDLQLHSLIEDSGCTLTEGVNLVNKSIIVVHPFDYSKPHHTFSNLNEFNVLIPVLDRYRLEQNGLHEALDAHLLSKQQRLTSEDARLHAEVINGIKKRLDSRKFSVQEYQTTGLRIRDSDGRFEYIYKTTNPDQIFGEISLYAYKNSFDKSILAMTSGIMISSRSETPNTYMFKSNPIRPEDAINTIIRFIGETSPYMHSRR